MMRMLKRYSDIVLYRYIVSVYCNQMDLYNKSTQTSVILFAGFASYCTFELMNYTRVCRNYDRLNQMRNRSTASRADIGVLVDRILETTPTTIQRCIEYTSTRHIDSREALVDSLYVPEKYEEIPYTQLSAGRTKLKFVYYPLIAEIGLRTIRRLGNAHLRWIGFRRTRYPTQIGDYHVWSRIVPGTKPIVFFPGFGLGAVAYGNMLRYFRRTAYIVEIPNLGMASDAAPGFITPETVYQVVRHHLLEMESAESAESAESVESAESAESVDCDRTTVPSHDIIAHSMGSGQAAFYVNAQYTNHTEDATQTVIICDGFVNPYDTISSITFSFIDSSLFNEYKHRSSWIEFMLVVNLVCTNVLCSTYTKRAICLYHSVLWREDYKANICYIYGERDLLYDVPFIASLAANDKHPDNTMVIPRARHGACLFGKKRNQTLDRMIRWMDSNGRTNGRTNEMSLTICKSYRTVPPIYA